MDEAVKIVSCARRKEEHLWVGEKYVATIRKEIEIARSGENKVCKQ
jgi:hypothetical protein